MRMANFYIRLCEGSEFDRHEFSGEGGPIPAEGKKTVLYYFLKDGMNAPSYSELHECHQENRRYGGVRNRRLRDDESDEE